MRALAFLLILAAAASCFSQGTVNFANGAAGVDAPVTNSLVSPSVRAAGPAFQAQLYVGPAGATFQQMTTNGVSGTPAPFETGVAAGYFFGGVRTIENYTPGTIVTLQVRVWNNSGGATSFETAHPYLRGESNLIQISLGNSSVVPNMVGLQGVVMAIPEPSSAVLAAMGLIASLVFGVRLRAQGG